MLSRREQICFKRPGVSGKCFAFQRVQHTGKLSAFPQHDGRGCRADGARAYSRFTSSRTCAAESVSECASSCRSLLSGDDTDIACNKMSPVTQRTSRFNQRTSEYTGLFGENGKPNKRLLWLFLCTRSLQLKWVD